MATRINSPEVKKAAQEVKNRFLIPFNIENKLSGLINSLPELEHCFRLPLEAFYEALIAVHSTTSFPYVFARTRAKDFHFQRIHAAQRVRSLGMYVEVDDEIEREILRDDWALDSARKKFEEFWHSDEGITALVDELAAALVNSLNSPQTAKAADEILYQGLISLWSAFEVFVRDELISLLNSQPELAQVLTSNPNAKKFFELPKLSMEELCESGFDLSKRMGTVMFGARDFSDIRTIRAALSGVFNDPSLVQALNHPDFWHLNQDRHLIVHCRGRVDSRYLKQTGKEIKVGEFLSIRPNDFEKYFNVVVDGSMSIINAFRTFNKASVDTI